MNACLVIPPFRGVTIDFQQTLDDLDQSGALTPARVDVFIVDACRLIPVRLPEPARTALETVSSFANHKVSREAVVAARVDCWKHLGARSCETTDPEVAAVRAVICALYPGEQKDSFESLDLFLAFLLAAGVAEESLAAELHRAFAGAKLPEDAR